MTLLCEPFDKVPLCKTNLPVVNCVHKVLCHITGVRYHEPDPARFLTSLLVLVTPQDGGLEQVKYLCCHTHISDMYEVCHVGDRTANTQLNTECITLRISC